MKLLEFLFCSISNDFTADSGALQWVPPATARQNRLQCPAHRGGADVKVTPSGAREIAAERTYTTDGISNLPPSCRSVRRGVGGILSR